MYLENFTKMHKANEQTLLKLVEESSQVESTESAVEGTITAGREKFVVSHRTFRRDPNFRVAVYEAS